MIPDEIKIDKTPTLVFATLNYEYISKCIMKVLKEYDYNMDHIDKQCLIEDIIKEIKNDN